LLAGDASFRTYFRLMRANGSAVIMDAPPPGEDVRPFVRIGRHLRALGLSAPEILAVDEANGFLLLEDLGDRTFSRMLDEGLDEGMLYERATDVLIALHAAGPRALLPGLKVYLGEALVEAAMLLPEWYVPALLQRPVDERECSDYRAAWRACLARLPANPSTLMLRDYHKDNLVWLPDRPDVNACGLLDFQDAQESHCAYDLVSLIEDARRDVSPAVHAACVARYIARTGVDEHDFKMGFAVMAAQRHARILGLFFRLARRDGKPEYLQHLPRVRRQFERALQHEAMAPLRAWVDAVLPSEARSVGAA
jgi:aminoglycoside/choline kinase family phosphotransferase